jgi:hypothetical protein
MKAAGRNPQAFALQAKRLSVFGLDVQATDVFVQAWLVLISLLVILFHSRIKDPWRLVLINAVIGLLYLGAVYLYQRASRRGIKFLIRTASVQLIMAYFFMAALPLQLIIWRGWQDQIVLNLERSVFGAQPTVWLEKFISPGLTEWMMFSYVIYLPIYPILSGILYFRRSERHMEDYLFTLAIMNFVCSMGFILFPVAGPLFKIADQYTVPLKGYFFTFLGEWIRNHVQAIGGCIPSPHCAVATVMWVTAYRYHRPTFYLLSPIILSLYVSAFYGRYHYLTDAVIGILAAWFVLRMVPFLMKGWNARLGQRFPKNI